MRFLEDQTYQTDLEVVTEKFFPTFVYVNHPGLSDRELQTLNPREFHGPVR